LSPPLSSARRVGGMSSDAVILTPSRVGGMSSDAVVLIPSRVGAPGDVDLSLAQPRARQLL
ncbi:MAG: hypothetical protein QM602_12725, partial [Microbacterium sp.]